MVRAKGTLRRWDDARGFGFIEPDLGGPLVFVHIKAFSFSLPVRPQIGQRLSYELGLDGKGGQRASRAVIESAVAEARPRPAVHDRDRERERDRVERRQPPPARAGGATLLVLPLAAVAYALGARLWAVPAWVGGWFALASAITFLMYAHDKSAARGGRWRTSESSLHLAALIGGWPGALLAQQILRHKSTKASFRSTFWATVAGNLLGWVLLFSPLLQRWMV